MGRGGTTHLRYPNNTLAARLSTKRKLMASGCVEYTAYVDKQQGYGKINNKPGPPLSAHVAAWITLFGPVPVGLLIRHKCDNRLCVEPRHLELGTNADNIRDMVDRGRCNNPKKSACPRGHPHDSVDSKGFGACSICRGIQRRRRQISMRRRLGKKPNVINCVRCYYALDRCKCAEFDNKRIKPQEVIDESSVDCFNSVSRD